MDGRWVLVIEGDADVRKLLGLAVAARSLPAVIVRRAAEAETCLRARVRPPNAVLVDLAGDPWSVRERLLADPRMAAVPMIVIAPPASPLDAEDAPPARLPQPVRLERLYALIERHCGDRDI